MKTAPITVEYLDHMGSDLDVVNAARVSFAKTSKWETQDCEDIFNVPEGWSLEFEDDNAYLKKLSEQDQKLIKYLAEHNHWSPFSHCYLKFRIKAPIFVARQLQKHTVGLAWNEVSRRYVDDEPEFYFPDTWRAKAENVKQGSSHTPVQLDDNDPLYIEQTITANLNLYNYLLDMGTCAEQARLVLPQNTVTTWIWSGSLAAFARVVKLRTDPHSQYETGLVAHGIKYSLVNHFPYSTEALLKL